MVFGLFLYKENKNFTFRKPLVKVATSIFLSASSIERASLLKRAHQACSGFLVLVPPYEVRSKLYT